MASSTVAAKRRRVQVDLADGDWLLLGRAVSGEYHRGRRLRELMMLGLAAEMSGLTYVMEDRVPSLRGKNAVLLGLGPDALSAISELPATSPPAAVDSEPQQVVLPSGFMDQF